MKWERRKQQRRLRPTAAERRERLAQIIEGARLSDDELERAVREEIRRMPIKHPPHEPPGPSRLAGKVIGYRGWTLDGYQLGSANRVQHGGHWDIGPNRAVCRIKERAEYLRQQGDPFRKVPGGHRHAAPDPDCECGLYAYFRQPTEAGRMPMHFAPDGHQVVWGAVTAWGRLEVHADGFRAEYAEPVILAYHPRDPYEDVVRLQTIAGELGLPLVTFAELPAAAREFGQEVPVEMRPERRRWLLDAAAWLPVYESVSPPPGGAETCEATKKLLEWYRSTGGRLS